jgi:pimeloyl-ACP methyl ester carboxylesterase
MQRLLLENPEGQSFAHRARQDYTPPDGSNRTLTSWGTLVALYLALDHPADVRSLVLLSGYYFPTFRGDMLTSLPTAVPIIGDLLSCTVAPLLGRAMRSRVFRKLFAPVAVPPRFQADFPSELSLRPSQLKASAEDTVSMTPSAAAWRGPEIGSLTSRVNLSAWTKSWQTPLCFP